MKNGTKEREHYIYIWSKRTKRGRNSANDQNNRAPRGTRINLYMNLLRSSSGVAKSRITFMYTTWLQLIYNNKVFHRFSKSRVSHNFKYFLHMQTHSYINSFSFYYMYIYLTSIRTKYIVSYLSHPLVMIVRPIWKYDKKIFK